MLVSFRYWRSEAERWASPLTLQRVLPHRAFEHQVGNYPSKFATRCPAASAFGSPALSYRQSASASGTRSAQKRSSPLATLDHRRIVYWLPTCKGVQFTHGASKGLASTVLQGSGRPDNSRSARTSSLSQDRCPKNAIRERCWISEQSQRGSSSFLTSLLGQCSQRGSTQSLGWVMKTP